MIGIRNFIKSSKRRRRKKEKKTLQTFKVYLNIYILFSRVVCTRPSFVFGKDSIFTRGHALLYTDAGLIIGQSARKVDLSKIYCTSPWPSFP